MKHLKPAALLCLSALLFVCGGCASKQVTKEEFLATARSYDKEKAVSAISSAKETGRFLNKILDPVDEEEERREIDYPSESFQYLFFSYDETRTSMIYDGTFFFDKNDGPMNTGLTFGFYETRSWLSKSADNAGGALSFKGTFEGELTLVNGRRPESPIRAKAECEFRVNAYGLHEKYSTVITVDGKEVYVYQVSMTYVYKN